MIKLFVNEKGFTLMELLIAVAIVVILAGVGIPVYLRFMTGSKHAEASTNLSGIKLSEEGYKLSSGVYAACGVAPRAIADLDEQAFSWADATAVNTADYTNIDFTISGDVRFIYEVGVDAADPTSFEAGALGDTDGDGTDILFTCTNLTSPAVVAAAATVVTNGTLTGGPTD
jgi:prepilin-type N-terminal cleavage/methylation domain-containing protein